MPFNIHTFGQVVSTLVNMKFLFIMLPKNKMYQAMVYFFLLVKTMFEN